MKFTVEEILAATGGKLLAGRPDGPAGPIVTDTRALRAEETFLALRGERFDGHDFLADAAGARAAAIVADREDRLPTAGRASGGPALILVKDTFEALADLGRAARWRIPCPVIAVTGSCGKTTVKEMLGQILAQHRRGRRPPASFNNQVGVPLTLLAAEPDDEFVLCEFGTNSPGEIALLASIARPTVAVVTLVAPAHLEGLKSLEGVAREKAALVESLGADGVAILNADDPRVAAMAQGCRGRVVTVAAEAAADLRLENLVQTERALSFTVGPDAAFDIPVLGAHQALLALLAAAAAREVGVALEESAAALKNFQPLKMRLALVRVGDLVLLNDAYNANPQSMRAALDILALWPERRKVFFMGDMRELGDVSRAAHEEIGRAVAEAGVGRLVCVGPESRATADAAVAAGLKKDVVTMLEDATTAAALAPSVVQDGDVVLVKGSRALGMERVAEAIQNQCGARSAECGANSEKAKSIRG